MPLTFGRDILDEGEFVQLICIVSKGDEPLRLTWSLKGDDVSSEPSLSTTVLGTRTSMLTISSVGYRHSGTYTCRASNDAGTTTQSAELKVNGNLLSTVERERLKERGERALEFCYYFKLFIFYLILSFKDPPRILPLTFGQDVMNEGQFAQVVCIVTEGDEPLSITWSLQGEVVSSEPGLSTTTLGSRTSMLTIQSIGYRHSGTYTCTATNNAGSRSQSVELKVNGGFNNCKSSRERERNVCHILTF